MHFKYRNGLSDPGTIEQIRALLAKYDNAFIPPLSQRSSSTQAALGPNSGTRSEGTVDAYLDSIKGQGFILAIDSDSDVERVAGFLAFKQDYECAALGGRRHPCHYVTTVLIDEDYRGLRLTYDLYNELFAFVVDEGGILNPIATRTWDSETSEHANGAHIHILEQLGFELVKRIKDDRGDGIDTVYYRKEFSEQQAGLLQRLISTHTLSAFAIAGILIALTVFSAIAYLCNGLGEEAGELMLAFTTSLLVSAVCLIIDAVSQYKLARNEKYLTDMRKFGIDGLNFDKQLLLIEHIHNAHDTIWLSGCRHILNSSIAAYLQRAISKGMHMRVLSSPPWSEAYRLIYDDAESTINNYIKLFRMTLICDADNRCSDVIDRCEFRFSDKPFFSDIYRIDDTIITSAFSYYGEKRGSHLDGKTEATARDFFTMVTHDGSKLFNNMYEEYITLWNSCELKLDNEKFIKLFPDISYRKMSFEKKCDRIRECLVPVCQQRQ